MTELVSSAKNSTKDASSEDSINQPTGSNKERLEKKLTTEQNILQKIEEPKNYAVQNENQPMTGMIEKAKETLKAVKEKIKETIVGQKEKINEILKPQGIIAESEKKSELKNNSKVEQTYKNDSTIANKIEEIKSKLVDQNIKNKSPVLPEKPIVENAVKEFNFVFNNQEVAKIQDIEGAQVKYDESSLELQGYIFNRSSITFTKGSYVYPAKGMTTVPVVCKVTLLNCCSPRVRENLVKNAARILRFVGGNGLEPPNPAFIRVYGIFQIDNKFYVFMNQVENRSILNMIKSRTKFSQTEARQWLRQIFEAVQFVQQRAIAHRSIMIDHVLFDMNKKQAKLSGWGRSVFFWDPAKEKVLYQNKEVKSMNNSHMPPEAFVNTYNPALADNWSLGVMVAALHTRRYVFKVKSKVDYEKQWKEFVAKHRLSSVVINLLQSVFVLEINKRATLTQMLDHKYWTVSSKEIEQPSKKKLIMSKVINNGTKSKKAGEEESIDIEEADGQNNAEPTPVTSNEVPVEEGPGLEIPKEKE